MRFVGIFFSARLWTGLAFVLGVMPLCLSSTEMWDGVVGIHALTSGDWATLKGWLLDSNWYLTYGLFLLADTLQQLTALPYWVFFKLWIILMIVGIAREVQQLALDVFEVPGFIARWLPALIFSFPLWYVFFSFTPMLGHLTCVWLALTGYRLIYRRKKLTMVSGFFLIAMSFQLASNCAFLLALEAGRWLVCKDKVAWSYRRSAFLMVLALGVFSATRVLWPPVSTYVGYNQFLNPLAFASWIEYAKHLVLFGTWLVLLVPMAIGLWWHRRCHESPQENLKTPLTQGWRIWVFWALLTLSTCLPYAAVGLGSPLFVINLYSVNSVSAELARFSASGPVSVWYGGWGARHMLLMFIPLVLFATWSVSRSQNLILAGLTRLHPTLAGAFVAMASVGLVLGVSGHWAKLERIAHERTVVRLLASKPVLPYGEVELLLDKNVGYLVYMYEANYLLFQAYNASNWSALMLPDHPSAKSWGEKYRAHVFEQSKKNARLIAKLNVMDDYSWGNNCRTIAKVKLPELSAWDVLWRAEHSPERLPAAEITPVSSNCLGANSFWR